MGIRGAKSLIHWNYFLALESDLAQVSRYIEFSQNNFRTYSIELASLLLASSSEVDVLAKGICKLIDPKQKAENIVHYRNIITKNLPEFSKETIYVPRFSLTLNPWLNWKRGNTPLWWESYNKVKHERNEHFAKANLKNVLNSMSGLLVSVFYFYKLKFISDGVSISTNRDVTYRLRDELEFLQLPDAYYNAYIMWGP